MTTDTQRSHVGRAYLVGVPWIGAGILGWSLGDLVLHPPDLSWLWLATLTLLTGSFTVKIPGLVARLSVSEPFVFAAALWFGPSVGAITAALDAMIMSLWLLPGLKTPHRFLFNVSVVVISIWAASQLFFATSGVSQYSPSYSSLTALVVPLYLFAAVSFVLNSSLVATALAIERQQPGLRIWRDQFLWLSVNYFGGASVAALLVIYAKSIDWAVVGTIIPLLAISYLTFRTTLGRLEDANRHLGELNVLHWSTIETLALAVDAKDQITHGHIRRVQRFALGLSRILGVTDPLQLQAIEAASLLHDMGKLAIPESILNKPGKLTPAEFETMKMHAELGAELLSTICFPYPVVPIVRHHHENWDGSGYPDQLKTVDIPIGARVLSVVDCFDALTSDRPYRPQLTTAEAIAVLLERRGTMYDPLVVDTFIDRLQELGAHLPEDAIAAATFQTIADLNAPSPSPLSLNRAVSDAEIELTLLTSDISTIVMSTLGQSTSVVGCAYYLADANTTALTLRDASPALATYGLVVAEELGTRIVGWSAATHLQAINAPASIQFGRGQALDDYKCSAFPARTTSGLIAVLLVLAVRPGISDSEKAQLATLARDLSAVVVDRIKDDVCVPSSVPRAAHQ